MVERIRIWSQSIRTRTAHRVRSRLVRLHSSEWLASAYVVGGMFGAATLVRIGPGSPYWFELAPTSETYLNALIGLLITFVGFVIIAVVFVYEQQRRAWRIAFRIRDQERRVVVRGAALSIGLVVVAIWAGLVALRQDPGGLLLLEQMWPTLIAAVAGFSGTAGSVATVIMGVRLLSSRQLAARILSAPERISARDESEEPVHPAEHLMELALAEHRAEDDEEFRSRIGSLRRYGEAAESRANAFGTVRALLDVAILVHERRGRAMTAVLAAQRVLESNVALRDPDGARAGIARDGQEEQDATERDKLLRKALALLDQNLSHNQPSGSLLRETIELGRRIHPDSRRSQELVTRAVESTLFRVNPNDLWENVVPALLRPPFGLLGQDHEAERALVIALTHATDPGVREVSSSAPGTRLAATRILELLPQLSVLADGAPDVLDHVAVQQFYVGALLCLRWADPSAADVPVRDSIMIVRDMAYRARHSPNYNWSAPLPAGYRSSLIMLSEIQRVLDDRRTSLYAERTGRLPQASWGKVQSAGMLLTDDPSVMIDVVEFVLDQYPDIVEKRRALIVIRLLLGANKALRGISALGNFVVLKAMASYLHRGLKNGEPLGDLGTLDMYFNPTSQPTAGFFSSGLVDCSERAVVLLEATNSLAKEIARRAADGLLTNSDGRPDEKGGEESTVMEMESFVVFGRFALLLAAALAVHLDDYDGIAAFGRFGATMAEMPIDAPSGASAASVGQMLLDSLALATLVYDFVKERTESDVIASDSSDDSVDTNRPIDQRINLGRTLESVAGLELVCRICATDLPDDVEDLADLEASLSELRDATDLLVKALAPPMGEAIIDQVSLTKPRTQTFMPWSTFPDWAWQSAAESVTRRREIKLPDRATLSMVTAITSERSAVWRRTSGFTEFVEQLVENQRLSSFAQGMLTAMLADMDASRGDLEAARARLETAQQTSHDQVAIRQMFMDFATSDDPPEGRGLHFARRLAREQNPRKTFACVEIGLRWMRATRQLTLLACTRKFRKISDRLVPVALAEQALRGHTLDARKALRIGTGGLARFSAICQETIERMDPDATSQELITGLDEMPDTARLAGLHIVQISIAAQLRSREELDRAHEAVEIAVGLLEDVPASLAGQLRTSLAHVRSLLGGSHPS